MSTITGTIDEVNLLQGPGTGAGSRRTYALSCSFAAMTAGDDAVLVSADTAITSRTKKGRTFTIRRASTGNPGVDASGLAPYASQVITNTSGTLALTLTTAANTAAAYGACSGVQIIVVGDES